MQQSHGTAGDADYFSSRDLHPRTWDCAAFTGRASGSDVSPRSDFHDDVLTRDSPIHDGSGEQVSPTSADVELEGVTADGGLAVNVGFDSKAHLDLQPDENHTFEQVGHLKV